MTRKPKRQHRKGPSTINDTPSPRCPPFVSHVQYDTTSPLKLVENNWNIPALTAKDAATNNMSDFFNFGQTPKTPLILTQRTCPTLTAAERQVLRTEDPD